MARDLYKMNRGHPVQIVNDLLEAIRSLLSVHIMVFNDQKKCWYYLKSNLF